MYRSRRRPTGRRTCRWLVLAAWAACAPGVVAATPLVRVVRFPGTAGPQRASHVPVSAPTSWRVYSAGSDSRLAIWLTTPRSNWLGLAHGLKTIGVPFLITRSYAQALRHRVVLVYPRLPAAADALAALAAFPRADGTLLTLGAVGHGLNATFGVATVHASRTERSVQFARGRLMSTQNPRLLGGRFNTRLASEHPMGVYTYGRSAGAIAWYHDGQAAVVRRHYPGHGTTYAIGLDLGYLLLRGYGDHLPGAHRYYDDHFEPTLDVFLRFLKSVYAEGEPAAVTLWTAPDNQPLSVVLTHDVDFAGSVTHMTAYARLEHRAGVSATYFMQTKYIKDWEDRAFFDETAVRNLGILNALGMSLGSHSVSHAPAFAHFPLGTGRERYPEYVPFVENKSITYHGTVLGELRVSRFLLHHFFPQQPVRAFRAGYLLKPVALPEALAAAGYRYDSSATADESLTHLPFQLNENRGYHQEVPVFEFPITLEDQVQPSLLAYYPRAQALTRALSQYGALCLVLIHPNVLGTKYAFERRFLAALKGRAWIGSLGAFGHWWRARNAVSVDVTEAPGIARVALDVPVPLDGLTLSLPAGWTLTKAHAVTAHQMGRRVVLGPAEGTVRLTFKAASIPAVAFEPLRPAT